jgi:hypothetical protein
VNTAPKMQDIDNTQLPRRYAKCEGALNKEVLPAWYNLSARYAARCCCGERAVDLGGSLTEARFGMVVRFGPALAADEADRKERAKDERWAGASFDVS